jgi:hypothetical protein
MTSTPEPRPPPRNRDQILPRRKGELIDDERDKKPERDEVPDKPPTEPEPPPVKEPPEPPDIRGPLIARLLSCLLYDRAKRRGAKTL